MAEIKENFNDELIKDWNELIDEYLLLREEANQDNDFHASGIYTSVLIGINKAINVHREVVLAQLIYSDLVRLEVDELILKYPII